MKRRKSLQELTIKDNFMFGAVMIQEENCRRFLEIALEMSIDRIEVDKEKSIVYHPEYKGVRLDVYARDEKNTRYNVEMQIVKRPDLGKRSRYYHSQIDMELLTTGEGYVTLPDRYVIFVCDFDPFGEGKYCYTFENCCLENTTLKLKDGCKSIFLSTCGTNEKEVSDSLVKFLKYIRSGKQEITKEDEFVTKIQKSILQIKKNREMEEQYMLECGICRKDLQNCTEICTGI